MTSKGQLTDKLSPLDNSDNTKLFFFDISYGLNKSILNLIRPHLKVLVTEKRNEPRHENILHVRKQRRRSAAQ